MTNRGDILVVDDTTASLELISRMLKDEGYAVRLAESGELALSAAENKPPELILLDVRMPGLDGFEVFKRLKAKAGTVEIPVIFLTASVDPEDSLAGLRLGAVDFISKPFDRKSLLAKVSNNIDLFRLREKLKQQALELSAERDRLSLLLIEMKRSEAAQSESEKLYRSLFENMLNGFAYCRMLFKDGKPQDFVYLSVNAAFERQTGLKDVIGKKVTEVIPGIREADPELLETYGRVALTGRPERFEIFIKALKMWFAVTAYSPSPEHFVAVFDVITARKQAELEQERLLKAIEQSGEAIVVADSDGSMQYVNPAFEKITGYSREEAVGKTPRLLKSGLQDEAFYKDLWGKISSGKTWEGCMVNKRKDGTLYTEDATISPVFDPQGRIINYVAVKRDITGQLKLENNLRQAQKMETIGLLAGGVAHDFNNILSAIMCNAGFLAKELAPGDPKLKDVKEILAASERAATLTRQLLAFSRRQIMATRVTDINGLVGGIVRMLGRVIGERTAIAVKLNSSPCTADVDPAQIEQVIMNLALNARDAMPGGGIITLETEILNPPEEFFDTRPDLPHGPLVCLKVSDTGCGMSEEVKSHLFEPFFTTKEQGKGTGLGLSTVFGIVKQSHGEIAVESEPGKGSAFFIYLPFKEIETEDKGPGENKRPEAKGHETVLLVEDEESLRRLGERILLSGGYKVLAAADGQAALKLMEERGKPVDLLMSDVVMPGMSGRELGLELARRKLVDRALYMSGYTDEAIVRHGVLEPGIAFIYKPYTVEALLKKLREALDGPAGQAKV